MLETYNSGNTSLFPVSSTLILGEKNAILIDAQFEKNAKKTGRKLESIYIIIVIQITILV